MTQSQLTYDEFAIQFARLRDQYSDLQNEYTQNQLIEAPRFNIFDVLKVSRDEIRHSAFLCHLLSPNENHGQGFLFLSSFLQYCANKFPAFPSIPPLENPAAWLVTTEKPTHFGRMDIVIQNPTEGFLLVIENKVDAVESEDQLDGYGKWMTNHRQVYPHQMLFFLSLFGSPSYTAGTTPYQPLSYHHDIATWLQGILEHIQAPAVHSLIRQYLGIVTTL